MSGAAAETSGGGSSFAWEAGVKIVGNQDSKVSPYLKVWIVQPETAVCVCGLIGEGTSEEIVSNWTMPFSEDTLGATYQKVDGILQATFDGATLRASTLATRQVWEGNAPNSFSLSLVFYSLSDAKTEVMDAIQALREMMAPDVGEVVPTGRIPQLVSLNIGRNVILEGLVVKSVSIPWDTERTRDGLLARATVQVQIETLEMMNLDRVRQMAG